jgi:hypothetical protein
VQTSLIWAATLLYAANPAMGKARKMMARVMNSGRVYHTLSPGGLGPLCGLTLPAMCQSVADSVEAGVSVCNHKQNEIDACTGYTKMKIVHLLVLLFGIN